MDISTDEDGESALNYLSLLPTEIFVRLGDNLEIEHLLNLRRVSVDCYAKSKLFIPRLSMNEPLSASWLQFVIKTFPLAMQFSVNFSIGPMPSSVISSLSTLSNLRSVCIKDVSRLDDPQTLINALFGLKSLVDLELDFAPISNFYYAYHHPDASNLMQRHHTILKITDNTAQRDNTLKPSPVESPKFRMSPLMNLTNLKHLVLRDVPQSWNLIQDTFFSRVNQLITLDISYRVPPPNIDFLSRLNNLKKLRLSSSRNNFLNTSYKIPFLPHIEQISTSHWCLVPQSLESLQTLRVLSFTPWNWKPLHLAVFQKMPLLNQLEMHVNTLPKASQTSLYFKHIHTLSLHDFVLSRSNRLHGLSNLRHLCLDADQDQSKLQPINSYIPPLLIALPRLISFSLINVPLIPSEISKAILRTESQIRHLELSGTLACMQKLISLDNESSYHPLHEFTAHVDGRMYKWKSGERQFTVTPPPSNKSDILAAHLF